MELILSTVEMQNLVRVGKKTALISTNELKFLDALSNEINLKEIDRDLLNKLIQIQKHIIKNLQADVLSETKDLARFESEVYREKIYNLLFFTISMVVIPLLICLALYYFAPAAIPAINYVYNVLFSMDTVIEFPGFLFMATLPPALYIGFIYSIRSGIETLLGKKIFTEKSETACLVAQLANEEALLNKLKDHKVSLEEKLINIKEPNIALSNASPIDSIVNSHRGKTSVNYRNSLFSVPSSQANHIDNPEYNTVRAKHRKA